MKVCAFQPQYPFTAAETDAYVQFLLKTLDECDESLDLIVLPECCNAPGRYKDKEEFIQIGLIALWEASRAFDPAKGQFMSYAFTTIKGRMLSHIQKTNQWLPVGKEKRGEGMLV